MKLVDEQTKVMNDMASALEKIKSKEDVVKVKGELESLSRKIKDLEERGKNLGEPTPQDGAKLLPRLGDVMKAANRLQEAAKKAETAAGADAFKGILPPDFNKGGRIP